MLNKKLLSVFVVVGAVFMNGVASADSANQWYAGFEGIYNKFGLSSDYKNSITSNSGSMGTSKPGVGFFGGYNFSDYAGVETGYNYATSLKSKDVVVDNAAASAKVSTHNFYVDAMGYMPVAEKVTLIGSAGLGLLSAKSKTNYDAAGANVDELGKSKTSVTPRLGAGVKYAFTDALSVRAMARYQHVTGSNKVIKHNSSLGLGLVCTF